MKKVKKVVQASMPKVELYTDNYFKKGKALYNIALGFLLVSYAFGLINFVLLAGILGVLFCLKGIVQFFE
jgi:hypothetical protein